MCAEESSRPEPSQKVRRVQAYLAAAKDYRRWRLWCCFTGCPDCGLIDQATVKKELHRLHGKGFRAKVWAPLPRHKHSGHVHVVVLTTFQEFCQLAHIEPRKPAANDREVDTPWGAAHGTLQRG